MTSMPDASPEEREVLKLIAKVGGLHDTVYTSSGELAERLGVSQQTASRKILDLLDEGLITRRMGTRKQHLRLSPEGVEVLRREYAEYKAIFEEGNLLTIRGTVVSGLGEGEYYISRDGYRKQFNRIFGFDPYPGTLNVEVNAVDREKLEQLQEMEGTVIPEFQSEGRTFGAVKCFQAEVSDGEPDEGVDAGAILPVRSHHSNVLEVISPRYLRDALGLEDGTVVTVVVDLRAGEDGS